MILAGENDTAFPPGISTPILKTIQQNIHPRQNRHVFNMTATHSIALSSLYNSLDPIHRISDSLPLSFIRVFLMIVMQPGRSTSDYAKACGCGQAQMSHRLSDLGETTRKLQPGLGLITSTRDPMDRRILVIHPTARGLELAAKIAAALERRSSVPR
jgi:DNA-binding MarR family transcriptional regulator